jgi:hypothetical protein
VGNVANSRNPALAGRLWAVVNRDLVVRKIPDEQPILKFAVREK